MLSTKLYTRWPTINAHFLLNNTLTLNQHNITSAPWLPIRKHPAPKKLFVVCCNATWNGPNESDWLVAPSQAGETDTYIAHIKGAFEALWDDEEPGQSAIIFSGYVLVFFRHQFIDNAVLLLCNSGPVRRETQTSMGASYLSLSASPRTISTCFTSGTARRVNQHSSSLWMRIHSSHSSRMKLGIRWTLKQLHFSLLQFENLDMYGSRTVRMVTS